MESKTITQMEINEAAIANSFCSLFKINNYTINSGNYDPIDLYFQHKEKFAIEIKCREKKYNGMLLERGKLIKMKELIDKRYQVRYMNYIEDTDELFIYNINKRIKRGELLFASYDVENYNYYNQIELPNNQETKRNKDKWVKYLHFDEKNMGDFKIENYTSMLYYKKDLVKGYVYNGVNVFAHYENIMNENYNQMQNYIYNV
ncbi:hypothetical protein [Belliella pelovolcani]|uniref:Uncharacterized protein n=1 Tax=Belliella pelovolcani TaxID=529505 RepID=A0A1N7MQX1_9BACT|nr:hypothetical protein [Belliella pelovolcani]SIS88462.1 hypothetical protein SAMN05421761_10749 [Belliella pelovolcani]